MKFLFSFAALIFFPPHGLSFWHQPLSCRCKGMAAGFGNKRSSLRFSKKSPHRWVVFFRKTLYFQPRRPWKAPETKRPMRQEDAKKMSEKGATNRWRNENFPSVPGTANKFNSRLYDNKHQHNTDLVEITLRSRLNPHHFGGLVGIYGSLHGRWSHIGYLQPIITQYFIDNKSEIWLLFLIAHSKRWRFNAFIDY